MASAQVNRSTRTIHTLHIDVTDDTIAAIEAGDEVEIMITSRVSKGRMPRPQKLSYAARAFLIGKE